MWTCNALQCLFVRVCHALGYARTAITKYTTQFCLLSFVNLHTITASAKVWVGGCTFRRKCLWLIRRIGLHLMVALFLQHVIHTLLFSDPVHTGVNTFWPNHRSLGYDSQCLLVLHTLLLFWQSTLADILLGQDAQQTNVSKTPGSTVMQCCFSIGFVLLV